MISMPKKDGASQSYKFLAAVQNLHCISKDGEPGLKIDVRKECRLGGRGDVVTGVSFSFGIVCGSLCKCQQNF